MKKIVAFVIAGILAMGFNSCKDEGEASFLGADIKVSVENMFGAPQKGTTVYLYEDHAPTASISPSEAKKQVVTNDNGIAIFDLNFTELNIIESQTTLYFAVFYTIGDEHFVAGSAQGLP